MATSPKPKQMAGDTAKAVKKVPVAPPKTPASMKKGGKVMKKGGKMC